MNTNSSRTVFVLGAGASKEVGLPTGAELKSQISAALNLQYDGYQNLTSGDRLIHAALAQISGADGHAAGEYRSACHHISGALEDSLSIDNFMDSHRDNERIQLCGKLAIARKILQAEESSLLAQRPTPDGPSISYASLRSTWFASLAPLLTENTTIQEVPERLSRLTFVVFNYDRCVEQYLLFFLIRFYGIGSARAAALVNQVTILHPYGAVGTLPWRGAGVRNEFGGEPTAQGLFAIANELRTFTEGMDESSGDVSAIRSAIANAEKVAFLGFAFHPLNLDLLLSQIDARVDNTNRRVLATAHGLSVSDIEDIRRDLERRGLAHRSAISIHKDVTCAGLFTEHSRGLSLSR